MNISLIEGYEDIIEELMIECCIKGSQRNKVDQLIRNALSSSEGMLDVDIRLLLEAGEYIYED